MKKKILLVDDLKSWLLFEADLLTQLYGDDVEIFYSMSAQKGLEKIMETKDNPFDVIITDLQMETDYDPLTAGEWLVEQVQNIKEYSKTPIIIISAKSDIKFIAQKYGVHFIPKYRLINDKLSIKLLLENLF